jgi:hypothetical protein
MALKKPFVTSDSETIKHYFSDVALFTNHKASDLAEKIQLAQAKKTEIEEKIDTFLKKDTIRWKNDILFINQVIEKT